MKKKWQSIFHITFYFLFILVFINNTYSKKKKNPGENISIIFEKTFGGKNFDQAYSIKAKKYGGYIIAGYTTSIKYENSDFWVIRINKNGKLLWEKKFGGPGEEKAYTIDTTKDGGFIAAGTALGKEDRGRDIWLIKLSGKGDIEWQKKYGQAGEETVNSVIQTEDGSYIIVGSTTSEGAGFADYLIIKFNKNGKLLWKKVYGGSGNDEAKAVQQLRDGNFIIIGSTGSKGAGGVDGWVMKINKKGAIIWERTIGGKLTDEAFDVKQTKDNGFIITGYSDSYSSVWRDVWIIKLDQIGQGVWENVFGGMGVDEGHCIEITKKGDFIIAGSSTSHGAGYSDFWVIKVSKKGDLLWDQTFGGKKEDKAYGLDITSDGSYLITGFTQSKGKGESDIWVLKIKEK